MNLAAALRKQGKGQLAIAHLRKALAAEPQANYARRSMQSALDAIEKAALRVRAMDSALIVAACE